jgi:phospholipid/cholesterol/gamma-HCH transport system substrate-binding protein
LKISKEIKTAILVLSSILLFIWGYSFLKGNDLFKTRQTFYVLFDNVEGLTTASNVTLSGLKVGKVKNIEYLQEKNKVKVTIEIQKEYKITKNSVIYLYEPSLMGNKQMMLEPNDKEKIIVPNKSYLIGKEKFGTMAKVSNMLDPLQTEISNVTQGADLLMQNLNNVLDNKSQNNLRNSMKNINKLLIEFNELSEMLKNLISKNSNGINSMVTNFDKTSKNLNKLSDSINQLNIGKTFKKLDQSLANVDLLLSDLQKGKGSAGKLLKDDKLYNNLEGASNELKLLIKDLKENPKRYINISVFGKKQEPYNPKIKDTITITY